MPSGIRSSIASVTSGTAGSRRVLPTCACSRSTTSARTSRRDPGWCKRSAIENRNGLAFIRGSSPSGGSPRRGGRTRSGRGADRATRARRPAIVAVQTHFPGSGSPSPDVWSTPLRRLSRSPAQGPARRVRRLRCVSGCLVDSAAPPLSLTRSGSARRPATPLRLQDCSVVDSAAPPLSLTRSGSARRVRRLRCVSYTWS